MYGSHYNDVTMSAMASQITSLTIVYSSVYSGADQRQHQNSASLAFVWGIHRWPVNSPHKGPVTRKMFPFDDVIMFNVCSKLNKGKMDAVTAIQVCRQISFQLTIRTTHCSCAWYCHHTSRWPDNVYGSAFQRLHYSRQYICVRPMQEMGQIHMVL